MIVIPPGVRNADYWLPGEPQVIAELKAMEEDIRDPKSFKEKWSALYAKWVAEGKAKPVASGTIVNTADLPEDCRWEAFLKLLKPSLERTVKSANEQIKQTRELLSLPEAPGLFVLANDGNYALRHADVLAVLKFIFQPQRDGERRLKSIDSYIYFSANMPAEMPGIDFNALIWVDGTRQGGRTLPRPLLDKLRQAWIAEHDKRIGDSTKVVMMDDHERIHTMEYQNPKA